MTARASRLFPPTAMLLAVACGRAASAPEPFDAAHEPCRYCRMVGSDGRFAGEIAAPGQEPLFFDDIGCLVKFLSAAPDHAPGAVAYVADHRTREWVRAVDAVYATGDLISTPMNSHLVAHVSAASRAADGDVQSARAVPIDRVFPAGRPPDGGPR